MKALQGSSEVWFSKAFNLPALQKSRLYWVDYLKGIAILLVVYRHVLIGIERSGIVVPNPLVNANMIFFSFRMPLFFILSGIFISGSIAKRSVKQLVYVKFEKLLYPYLVWSCIQITLQIILSGYTNADRSFIDYTYIFYQPRNLDQFWYLPALFNATVIYLLVKTKLKPPMWFQFVIGLSLYFLSSFVNQISILSDWMSYYIFFALGDAISGFFFKASTQRFLKNPVTLIAFIPIFVLTQLYYLSHNVTAFEFLVIALVGCLSMFVLAFRLQSWNILSFLRVLGYHSLHIYVMHVIVSAFIRMILTKVLGIHDPVILLFMGIGLGVTIPIIAYNLFIRENIAWFLFSPQSPKSKPIPVTEPVRIPETPLTNKIISNAKEPIK